MKLFHIHFAFGVCIWPDLGRVAPTDPLLSDASLSYTLAGATDELLLNKTYVYIVRFYCSWFTIMNKTHVYIVRFYCSWFIIVSWSPSYCEGALHATQIIQSVYWYKVQGISENPFLLCNKFKLYWDGRWDYTFLLVTCKIIIWTWLIQNHHQLTFDAGVLCLTI